uniref:Uncharacterized protein n=1 Tax=Anguilla anguilla TaxID=7936 RepID=A0A0E9PBL4_ANGAN
MCLILDLFADFSMPKVHSRKIQFSPDLSKPGEH